MGEEPKNENKPEFKGNLGFIWLVGILVILLGCTVVYVCKLKREVNDLKQTPQIPVQPTIQTPVTTQEQTKTENTTTATTEETKKVIKKLDDSKELVYTYASKKADKGYISFEIPYVNINSDYAKEINKKIKKMYPDVNKLVNSALNEAESLTKVSYQYYVNDSILSLVIEQFDGLQTEYYTYNIDVYTGKKVSNKEILKTKGISETKFLSKVEELCESEFNKYFAKGYDEKEKKELINDTIKKNKNINIKMFIDKNNNLNIIPTMCINVQISETEHIINTKL